MAVGADLQIRLNVTNNSKLITKEMTGQLTEAEINRLKAQHGKIYEITAEDDGEQYVAYFRRPDMGTLSAMTKMAKTDEIKASQILLENCFVGGADTVKSDTSLFMATVGELSKIVGAAKATIKNV